jgi:hypothetical protein
MDEGGLRDQNDEPIRRGDTIRTCDPLLPKQVRYQLRHAPIFAILSAVTAKISRTKNRILIKSFERFEISGNRKKCSVGKNV